jgi:T-complex protein 1 subunit theta
MSEVVRGVVVERPPSGNVHKVEDAKIALFIESIDSSSTETKGTVLLKSAEELLNYNEGEEKLMERMIETIAKAGARVVVSGGKISEVAMHFIEKFGLMAVRITSKFELRRLAKSVGARLNLSLLNVGPDDLGYCKRVYSREVGGSKVIVFEQHDLDTQKSGSASSLATIVLRGSTQNAISDSERAINDGVNVVRAVCKDPRFVPGAGASEIELSLRLSAFADTCTGLEQYAVKKFAESLEVFPRTLAENCGLVATEVLSRLFAAHERGDSSAGVEIEGSSAGSGENKGAIRDVLLTKSNALKLAYTTAVTILRVDQIIMSKPAGGPKPPQKQGHWDDEE